MLPSSNSPKKLEDPVVAMFIKSIVPRLSGATSVSYTHLTLPTKRIV